MVRLLPKRNGGFKGENEVFFDRLYRRPPIDEKP